MLKTLKTVRTPALLAVAGFLAACANGANLGEQRVELGDFRLCYNIVTINDAVQGPLSREADLEVFAQTIRSEIDRRFGRYEGDRLYHIAIHLDAYVLAVPGIPLVASPRSALIVSVNLWDDQLGGLLNEEPKQFQVLESLTGENILGSGLTQTAEEQMQVLAANAAIQIENWMAENPDWFEQASDEAAALDGAAPGEVAAAEALVEVTELAQDEAPDETAVEETTEETATAPGDPGADTQPAAIVHLATDADPSEGENANLCAYDASSSLALATQ
tara:strand:+ start:67 stop:894 length:828 start_codon:yes stop_codon:yes gene_type:complete